MFDYSIRILREMRGLTQEDLSKIIGITKSQYSDYEREYITIPSKHLIAIADYFKVSIDFLFGFTDKTYDNIKTGYNLKLMSLRLKALRKENKMFQKEFGQSIDVVQSMIVDYEHGKRLISTTTLYNICKTYKVSADYLLGRIDTPKYIEIKNKPKI